MSGSTIELPGTRIQSTGAPIDMPALARLVRDQLAAEFTRLGVEEQIGFGVVLWNYREANVHYGSNRLPHELMIAIEILLKNWKKPKVGG